MPDQSSAPILRFARADDEPFLLTMLFYAAHAGDDPSARPEHLLSIPSLARYVVAFGRAGDLGLIAEGTRGPVGAAWVRLLAGDDRGYGWVDDETPELAIAVAPELRGLYLRLGFLPREEKTNRVGGVSETMVLRFAEASARPGDVAPRR